MGVRQKKSSFGLEMKIFRGKSSQNYLVFLTREGAFHVFQEVEAKGAAKDCGSTVRGNTRTMWNSIWKK